MIISLRGTNGCGKSTLVRGIMKLFPVKIPIVDTTGHRRNPLGYLLRSKDVDGFVELFIPGHYEIKNGGVDTLKSLDEAYSMIETYAKSGSHVLYEGKNMSDGPRRLIDLRLRLKLDCRTILVSYPLEDCIRAVRERGHSIREQTIERLYRKSHEDIAVLEKSTIKTETLPRDAAYNKVREWLGV